MQNPTSPAVKLQIAGSSFDLVFDFEAIADAEEITGRALLTGLRRRDIEAPAINRVRAMLFACVHTTHALAKFVDVKKLVTRANLTEIWGKVLEAWTEGLAEPSEDAPADPPGSQS
jgi:hypothetical protein